jgi:hypothetical protein
MSLIRKAVSALGGIFLAALLIAAIAPRATHAVVAALVQVTNTTANPVPVTQASAFHPFQSSCTVEYTIGATGTLCFIATVPAGQRLVIQTVSVDNVVDVGLRTASTGFSFLTGSEGSVSLVLFVNTPFAAATPNGVYDVSATTQQVTAYADAGTKVGCATSLNGQVNQPGSTLDCELSGYTVPLP